MSTKKDNPEASDNDPWAEIANLEDPATEKPKKSGKKVAGDQSAASGGSQTPTDGTHSDETDWGISVDDDTTTTHDDSHAAFDDQGDEHHNEDHDDYAHESEGEVDGDENEDEEGESEPPKKKSNLKTYLILGGIATGLVSVIGGTLAIKSSMSSSKAPAPVAVQPAFGSSAPVQAPVQSAAPVQVPPQVQPQAQPQAQPVTPQAQPQRSVAQPQPGTPEALEAQSRDANAAAGRQPVSRDDFFAFMKKVDTLSAVFLQTQNETKKRLDAQDEAIARLESLYKDRLEDSDKKHEQIEEELRLLKEQLTEMQGTVDALSAKLLPKKQAAPPPKAAPAPADTRATPKPAPVVQAKPAPEPKPAPVAPPAPKPEQAPAPKPAPKVLSINGFNVVATYPAVGGDVKSQRAWVTNGQKLIEVSVGSRIGNAVITSINGSTVVTSEGSIKPKE